jgi:hypothetical protein
MHGFCNYRFRKSRENVTIGENHAKKVFSSALSVPSILNAIRFFVYYRGMCRESILGVNYPHAEESRADD